VIMLSGKLLAFPLAAAILLGTAFTRADEASPIDLLTTSPLAEKLEAAVQSDQVKSECQLSQTAASCASCAATQAVSTSACAKACCAATQAVSAPACATSACASCAA